MREVPYVNAQRQVRRGSLISSLTLAGDIAQRPDTHVVHFDGNYPCGADGTPIQQIVNQSGDFDLGNGLTAKHIFSSKPSEGYTRLLQKDDYLCEYPFWACNDFEARASPRGYSVIPRMRKIASSGTLRLHPTEWVSAG